MNTAIDYFINLFTIRGITSREQILNEILRVKLTANAIKSQKKSNQDEEQLFELMKQSTENTILGYFPGDRDFFSTVYKVAHNVDLIEFTLKLYQNDRFGQIFSPAYLTEYICSMAEEVNARTILITEAEKSLSGLKNFVDKHKSSNITFTTSNALMFMLLKLGFEEYKNVSILNQSIYQELLIDTRFDFIYSMPDFGGKIESLNNKFKSSRPDIIATQNLLGQLSEKGTLVTVLPAKITFSSGSEAKLREHIMTNYQLEGIYSLPEGTFRPYTSIKTYILRIGVVKKESVNVGYLGYDNGLYIDKVKVVGNKDFSNHEDWRIELIFEDDDENIKKYKSSTHERVKLHEVAEVFRGKSILKKDVKPGNIKVLNISNITDTGIDYSEMDSIEEEERKIKRYELMDGDIVLSCRGTVIKTGVFRKQKNIVIASANVIVIRPNHRILSDYLRIFFESPVGIALIKSFQRGTTIVNINHTDIAEMEIPLLSMEEQKELVTHYEKESSLYRRLLVKRKSVSLLKSKKYMKNYYKKGVEAMAIKEFEFMHGGVITRLLRKDIPLQLTLVETSSNDSKAVYKILSQNNNELTLYIKYRSRPEPRKKEGNTWIFNFTQKNLNELSLYKDGNFMIALVCGNDDKLNDSEVCLLDKQQVISCINIDSESNQTITVKLMGNKSFRAYGTMTTGDPLIIPRNRINTISI